MKPAATGDNPINNFLADRAGMHVQCPARIRCRLIMDRLQQRPPSPRVWPNRGIKSGKATPPRARNTGHPVRRQFALAAHRPAFGVIGHRIVTPDRVSARIDVNMPGGALVERKTGGRDQNGRRKISKASRSIERPVSPAIGLYVGRPPVGPALMCKAWDCSLAANCAK